MTERTSNSITQLLLQWRAGEQAAFEALVPLVYEDLRVVAHRYLQRERPGHSLQSAGLVHEVYLRLVSGPPVPTENRAHFVALAAKLMRQILVDHARAHGAVKRGAGCTVELGDAIEQAVVPRTELLALEDALQALSCRDEQQSRIVELRCFGGLTIEETADVLQISPATVKRDWNMAKAWLSREMRRSYRGRDQSVEQA